MSENVTNKVLRITSPGTAEWLDADMPTPRDDEIVLRVVGVTTCPHWDMRIFGGTPMFESRPLQYPYTPGEPGHEACGRVVAVGRDVAGFGEGDFVAVWRDPGGRRQGCYARFVAVRADEALRLPRELPPESIASLELAMCVQVSFDQLNEVDAIDEKRVVVGGLGPAGLIAVQMAKAYGAAHIIGTDLLAPRRELALAAGADEAIHPSELPDLQATTFDTGLDTTGLAVAIQQLIGSVRKTVAIFGVLREHVGFGPEHWWGGFTLMGYGDHNKAAAERALDLVLSGRLDLSLLVTKTLPMTSYAAGVQQLNDREAIKILFDPWSDSE